MSGKKDKVIKGTVFSGLGQGAFFTQLDWVKEQCLEKLGFTPFPGTLNIRVSRECLELVRQIRVETKVDVVPPTPDFCPANAIPVTIGDIKAAIVVPHAEEFTEKVHSADTIEVIAPVEIKKALGIKDGDEVVLMLG
jgi:CTP-dependent riboflavin kinase